MKPNIGNEISLFKYSYKNFTLLMLCSLRYKLALAKKKAKLNQDALKRFVIETIKEFGGIALLTNTHVVFNEDCSFEIKAEKEYLPKIHGAFLYTGEYNTIPCKFIEEGLTPCS